MAPTFAPSTAVVVQQHRHRGIEIARRAGDLEIHHQPARHVRVVGRLAAVEIRRQGHEALASQPIADVANVGHEPPPLLDHDHAGAPTGSREGEIAPRLLSVAGELDLAPGAFLGHPVLPRLSCPSHPAAYDNGNSETGEALEVASPAGLHR